MPGSTWAPSKTSHDPLRPPGLALRAPLPREVAPLADSLRSRMIQRIAAHAVQPSQCPVCVGARGMRATPGRAATNPPNWFRI